MFGSCSVRTVLLVDVFFNVCFVGEGELHVLLLHRLHPPLQV